MGAASDQDESDRLRARREDLEVLGTLTGAVAHDFNNILAPIFINIELALLEPEIPAEARRSLESALRAAERGRDLVKQVVAFSRRRDKDRGPVRLAEVVREALARVRAAAPPNVEIREDLRSEAARIVADPVQLHQLLAALSDNALNALRGRGGVLEVRLTEETVTAAGAATGTPHLSPGAYLKLTVSDTGEGMAPETLARACEPFFTTRPGEAAGVGLAVVQRVARTHGGAVSLTSAPGRGTSVDVWLPRLPDSDAA